MANWAKARKEAAKKPLQVRVNPTKSLTYDVKRVDELCAKIEAAYPELTADYDAVANSGAGKDGGAQKLAVYKRPKNKAENIQAANVILYGSGSIVWTGDLDPVTL